MPWTSFGTVGLNDWNWKYFNTPDLPGIETRQYKVKQVFKQGLIYPTGYFLIGFQCSEGGVYDIRKIYFDNQIERGFNSTLPEHMQFSCATRYVLIKLPKSARIDVANVPVIEVFQWN